MPKLTITQGKDGMFRARVFAKADANGKRPSKRIEGHSKKEVEEKAKAFLAEMESNPDSYRMTLAEAAVLYLDYLKTKKKPISPSTEKTYLGYIRQNFTDLHKIAIVDITEDMLQKEVYKLESKNTPKTIKNVVNFYVPCIHHFRRGFNPDLDLPDAEAPDIPIPDMNELREKIAGIKNKRLLIPVLLAAYCGLRRSEIAALDLASDIDYDVPVQAENGSEIRVCYIHINKAVVRGVETYVEKGTKTKAGERIVIGPAWLNDELKAARDDPDYVPYPPHKISSRFAEWAERKGINCSFHGLRHFYASVGDALGIPDLYMMEMMGHSTPYMLERYKEIMSSKRIEVNHTMLNYLQSNSPFAPQIAPLEIVNEE
jgi:integrase